MSSAFIRGEGGGKSLKLNGHVDVVPIGPPELVAAWALERRLSSMARYTAAAALI